MKTLYPALLLFFTLVIIAPGLQAQSTDSTKAATADSVKPHKHSNFEIEMTYQSNNVYLGRKDSEVLQYYLPSITYNHKSGMYFTASAAYLHNSTESRIDVFTLEGGYAFDAGIYSGDFTTTKYFYNSQSTSVTSGITFAVSYRNELDLGFITPYLTTSLDFGPTTDFNGSLGLEHEFAAFDNHLKITPTFVANGSTLNFYDSYFRTRRFTKRNGTKVTTGTVRITGIVQDAGTFRMLDYEFSLPLSYKAGHFTFSFTPSYALPVNPAIVHVQSVYSTGTTTNKTTKEKLENTFYWTLGVRYRF